MDPDIALTDGRQVRVAIDAKYKLENKQADVYQALAYAKTLGLQQVALVYPEDGEVTPARHRIRNDETEVVVTTIPVGHGGAGFRDLDARARHGATALITSLARIGTTQAIA